MQKEMHKAVAVYYENDYFSLSVRLKNNGAMKNTSLIHSFTH